MEKIVVTKSIQKPHQEQVLLENDWLEVKISPRLGGKITEIVHKETGTQFLLPPEIQQEEIPDPNYGDSFLPPHAFGFDECFPTVLPATDNENVTYPDHGELWSQAWNFEVRHGKVLMKCDGRKSRYTFQKEVGLNGNQLQIHYRVDNHMPRDLSYVWSSHPLLNVDAGDEILLPADVQQLKVYYCSDDIMEEGSFQPWPKMNNKKASYHKVWAKEEEYAAKLFAKDLKTGKAGFYRHKTDETLLFEFDTGETPALGMWLCYGAWPDDSAKKDYTIALEPTSCTMDELSEALEANEEMTVKAGESKTWSLNVSVQKGKTVL